ncbi:MAG: GerMN domain-containing protein [Aeromicrobium sp.]
MTARGAARGLAGAVAGLMVMAGCAAIPTSGPVTEVVEDSGFGQSTVRYSPALPTNGASPGEVVRGYLDAMLAYPSSTRTAAAFLTPAAADSWERQSGVTIYADAQYATPPQDGRARADVGETTKVAVDAAEKGRLDTQGRYQTASGRTSVDYRLEKVDGQWRITNPQPGLMVTARFFEDYFRPFSLYFFDRPARRLVPQPVHVLVEDGLAAALITALARGDESQQVRTFVPSLDDLRATVPVEGGVADVGFTAGSRQSTDVEHLSAQVVWTLRQVPDVSRVRISVGSSPVRPRSVAEQPVSSWGEFGVGQGEGTVRALMDNSVVEVDGADIAPIARRWGADADGATAVAMTDQRIALVAGNRASVRIAALDGGNERTVEGTSFIDPVSDVDGQIWLVDRPASGTRIRVVGSGTTTLDASSLKGLNVRSLDISPEAARYVITVGTGDDASVRVGRVVRDAKGASTGLSTPRRIGGNAVGPSSAVWSDDVRVSFLAETDTGIQMQTALIDGSGASATGGALLPAADISGLVVGSGPGASTYATDPRGRLWYLRPSGNWQLVDADPIRSLGNSR